MKVPLTFLQKIKLNKLLGIFLFFNIFIDKYYRFRVRIFINVLLKLVVVLLGYSWRRYEDKHGKKNPQNLQNSIKFRVASPLFPPEVT